MSRKCPDGCTCGRHDRTMLAARAARARGRKDPPEVRQRKSDASRIAWARRADRDTHTRPASQARRAEAQTLQEVNLRLERTAGFKDWLNRMHGAVPPASYIDEPVSGLDEHLALATRLGIRLLSEGTLRGYGLSQLEWLELAAAQGWMCPICQRRVHKLVTDHEHVPNWKRLPRDERKRFVRGLLCVYCNFQLVPSRMTAAEAARMAEYLHAYEVRRAS